MKHLRLSIFILLFLTALPQLGRAQQPLQFSVENTEVLWPEIIVKGIHQDIQIKYSIPLQFSPAELDSIKVFINHEPINARLIDGLLSIGYSFPEKETISLVIGNLKVEKDVNPIPLWLSILPPLIAIFFALLLREVYSALVGGIWVGTGIIYYYQGASFFTALLKGFFSILDTYIIQSLNDSGHLSIILFSMIIAGTVSLITRNGGMTGAVNRLARIATSPRSGAFTTWLLGVAIFFDDYANTLVVGNAMRPLTDKLRISREKLSYIIDSTAAPVASVAFVTTWIGAELSYIQDGITELNLDESAYGVFFNSLAYAFYPFFTLVFILILIWKDVDFGPMYHAEVKARARTSPLEEYEVPAEENREMALSASAKPRMLNALIPVGVIVFGTLSGLLYTGWNQQIWHDGSLGFFEKLSETIGRSDSYAALLWASFGSLTVATLLTLSQRLLSLKGIVDSIVGGFKTMLPAIMILTLAWSVALITKHLHTADFISQLLLDASISPFLIPTFTFIMAALVSFSTGSSWGTMAILYPLILPAGWLVGQQAGLNYEETMAIFHNIAAAVLTGSVLGDHCSPISDTTILSSLASSCPHIEHVRTQLPYALITGAFAIVLGILPASFGWSPWLLFPAGFLGMYLIIHLLGKSTEPVPQAGS